MSFELTNASIIFQIYINKTLINIVDVFCVIYFDDILIFFKNRITHVNHVKKVFRRFKKLDLYVNLKKCKFFVEKIEYLDLIISVDVNFANFYQRFIHRYSQITIFLMDMLRDMQTNVKKEFFIFTNDATTTFRRLKNIFQSIFILVHFDSKLVIRLKINAFDHDVIDIIFQLQTNNQ